MSRHRVNALAVEGFCDRAMSAHYREGSWPSLAGANADVLAGAFLAGYGSELTRAAYRQDLADFFAWCTKHAVAPLESARTHLEVYGRGLEQAGRSPAAVARRLSTLRGFFGFAVQEGVLLGSPAEHLRLPRVTQVSPTLGLQRHELGRLLAAAEAAGARDHALVCLLALNGLRASEACTASTKDMHEVRGHRTITIMRKGGNRAVVPLAPRTVAAIDTHLDGRADGPLLLDADGRALDRHGVARMVRRLARAAAIDARLSPYGLRHTFVTLALEAGVPLYRVQDAAGHADPRTTRRYDRARDALDAHATYTVASFVADAWVAMPADHAIVATVPGQLVHRFDSCEAARSAADHGAEHGIQTPDAEPPGPARVRVDAAPIP